MNMSTRKLVHVVTLWLAAMSVSGQAAPSKYAEGQVWAYNTRTQDAGSLLKIERVTVLGSQKVYHINIEGLHFGARERPSMVEVPVSQETLDASVTRPADGEAAVFLSQSEADASIARWQRAQGGVFTIPVSQIVDMMDKRISAADPTSSN